MPKNANKSQNSGFRGTISHIDFQCTIRQQTNTELDFFSMIFESPLLIIGFFNKQGLLTFLQLEFLRDACVGTVDNS